MNRFKWLSFFLAFSLFLHSAPPHAVTNGDGGGRFGDKLLIYLRAKWLSYKYQIPYYYSRFDHSTKLVLHKKETQLEHILKTKKYEIVALEKHPIDLKHPNPLLYVCPYFPENDWEIKHLGYYSFDVDWKDKKFRQTVLRLIAPKKAIQLIHPSQDTINIALHIREGGGVDSDEIRIKLPMKLPPLSFYLEGLAKIIDLFSGKPIACHLFTDAKNPESLIQELKAAIPKDAMINFTFREVNSCGKNVLEDFFSFFHFDVLIRPQSNFSIIPSLLHDYAVVYSPASFSIENQVVKIDRVNLDIDNELYEKLLLRRFKKKI